MALNVSVDCGRGFVKVASYTDKGEIEKFTFYNRIEENVKDRMTKDSYLVEYSGKNYRVGEASADVTSKEQELDKLSEKYKIGIYTAVALMIRKLENVSVNHSINLKVNVPLDKYKIETERERYKNFFDSKVSIRLDGRIFTFEINSVKVLYEGAGFLLSNMKKLSEEGKFFTLIDWGTLNLTFAEFSNELRINVNRCGSLKTGANPLMNKIYRELSSMGEHYSNYDIHEHLKGTKNFPAHAKEKVESVVEDFVEREVFAKLDMLDYNNKFVFSGGTSLLLRKYIEKVMIERGCEYEISDNAWFDNAVGYLKVGKK